MKLALFDKNYSFAKRSGFTIVELLVVIVILGMLVTITAVSYSSIQTKTRDTTVKNAAKQFALELQRFAADTGKTPLQTGGGWGGSGTGFVSAQYIDPVNYPVAVETVLVNAHYLPTGFTAGLPKNTKYGGSAYTLMLYSCGTKYVVFYSLEAPTSDDVDDFTNVKSMCGIGTTVETNYNMKGGYVFS